MVKQMTSAMRSRPGNQISGRTPLRVLHRLAWGGVMLRGLTAIAIGLIAGAWPAGSIVLTIALIAANLIVTAGTLLRTIADPEARPRQAWPYAAYSLVLIGVAISMIVWIDALSVVIASVFAAWIIAAGVADLGLALRIHGLARTWPLWIIGSVSLMFAMVLLVDPSLAPNVAFRLVSVFSLIAGAALVLLSLHLRYRSNRARTLV